MTVQYHIGTMGFGYKAWQGTFYPEKLPKARQLAYYATRFQALEMDSTFYGVPRAESVVRWREITPDGFKFCPKMPREITHDLKLSPAAEPVLTSFVETMRLLEDRLGPVVIQFPPDFVSAEFETLANFLPGLPGDLRFALEFRHRSWWGERTAELLRAHHMCWIAADYLYMPREIWQTTDFLYLRFLGRHGRFATKTHEVLDRTDDLVHWREQLLPHVETAPAVYAFFNNDYSGYSPATADRFKALLGLDVEPGTPRQGKLF